MIKNSEHITRGLQSIISNHFVGYPEIYHFPEGFAITLLYSTDDLFLTEHQFNALKSVINQDTRIYVTQNDEDNPMTADNYLIWELSADIMYDEYVEIPLFSNAIIFPNTLDWILIIEETLDGGVGILAGNVTMISAFESAYGQTRRDVRDLVLFHLEHSRIRDTYNDNLKRLLSMIR